MTAADRRILGFDLARGLAVLGMVLVNFSLVIAGQDAGPPLLRSIVEATSGRAAALFVVLAGVGVSLASRSARESDDPTARLRARRRLLRRALLLFAAGLAFAPLWPPDILHYYGIYLALAALLLFRPAGELWGWAAAVTGLAPLLLLALDYEAGWDFEALSYLDFWTVEGFLRNSFFNGFHPVVPWIAFLFVGMAAGRWDWRDPARRRRCLWLGAGVAVAVEALSLILVWAADSLDPSGELAYLVGRSPMPAMPLYVLSAAATALAAIAMSVEAAERWAGGAAGVLVDVGRLALTAYVAHVVLGVIPAVVAGWTDSGDLTTAFTAAASFAALVAVFARLWLRRFANGPFEALLSVGLGKTKRRHLAVVADQQ